MTAVTRRRAVRVLVAEDDSDLRSLVSRWMRLAGAESIDEAANGRRAVELAVANRPDVAVLDVDMPQLDGIAAIPFILASHPDCRIVMFSAVRERRQEALDAGASAWFTKGSDWPELRATMSSIFGELSA